MAHNGISTAGIEITETGDITSLLAAPINGLQDAASGSGSLAFAYGDLLSEVFGSSFSAAEGRSANNSDLITDFTNGPGGDMLDIHELLTHYDPLHGVLSDFVHATTVGSDTVISVNAGGNHHGNHFIDVATLQGVTGIDLNQMVTDGNLIVASSF